MVAEPGGSERRGRRGKARTAFSAPVPLPLPLSNHSPPRRQPNPQDHPHPTPPSPFHMCVRARVRARVGGRGVWCPAVRAVRAVRVSCTGGACATRPGDPGPGPGWAWGVQKPLGRLCVRMRCVHRLHLRHQQLLAPRRRERG